MKHSRNEFVKHIVSSYMKKRQYIENENTKKFDQPLARSAESSAVSGIVDMETSYPNSITYKCVQNEPAVAEAQFSALKSWINEIEVSKTSEELKALMFPMLFHIFIEMLNGGHHDDATAFLRKYQHLSSEEGLELLEELASVNSAKEIKEKEVLSCLRSSKYQVTMSQESLQILKQYLIRKSHVIILHIVNSWFDLEEAKPCAEPLLDICEDNASSQANGFDDLYMTATDNDLAKMEEIIRLVKEGPTSPAPLIVYSAVNADQSMSCGRVSGDSLLMAAGYTTSHVRLWSLTDETLQRPSNSSSTKIRLACDPTEDIKANEDSCEEKSSSNQPPKNFQYDNCVELLGHSGVVQDIAFMPSSDLMVSVSMDKTMRAWNLKSFECSAIYKGHNYPIWCAEASPLTGYVATGSHDRTARLWSLELNFPLRVFAGHTQDVDCLRFHPNGNYIATGSSDNSIRLWSVDSGELVRVFEGHRSGIMSLAFSPNGNQLASAGDDKRIKIWDLRTSSVVGEFRGYSDSVVSLDWSPNSDYIASGCMDSTVKISPVRNVTNDGDPSPAKFYHVACNSMCSVKFSSQNTPMCVVGIS